MHVKAGEQAGDEVTQLPFRLGTTSFIYPATWSVNVERLAGRVDDVELLIFEATRDRDLPDEAELAELAADQALRLAMTGSSYEGLASALAAHRVEQFRIQPGSRPGEVHFSCMQPVPGRDRVVRRFEAEAADPVRAARDVLQQIEQRDRGLSQVAHAP